MPTSARSVLPLALLLLAAPTGPRAEEPPGRLPATARYRAALREAGRPSGPTVEALYALATAAAGELQAVLVAADEATFAGQEAGAVPTAVDGIALSTEEALYAVPDPAFFAGLARKRGRPVDRAFFDLLVATRPEPAWPVYLEQQTDVTGCVRLERPELPTLYARWLGFRRGHPAAYRAAVAEELRRFDEALLGECVCGTREASVAALEAFVRAVPGAAVTARVKARLSDLRAGRAQLRAECHSG